ncbi:MAG: phosphonate ABC transporter, permease protein PhnE [Anaerolineales bacterium]|jgi:phosphonate transport system permease protein|nr:phosphonate ABC transporter, permease protein PhnE [Anaerolineales bacterium]
MNNRPSPRKIIRNVLFIAFLFVAFGYSWQVTELDLVRVFRDLPKGEKIILSFLTPELFTHEYENTVIEMAFPVPCGTAPEAEIPASGPRLVPNIPCAEQRAKFILEGYELAPGMEVLIRWKFPNEDELNIVRVQTDENGYFSTEIEARPISAAVDGVASKIQAETFIPVGGLVPSQTLKDVFEAIMVTIFMALLSTTVATIVAAPLSFLAASNITRRGCLGTAIYYFSRSIFNVLRSYDPLVMATVFGFWLSFGPFPGFLALTVVTIASLGKLFSEAVENIDEGPIEALQATGATRLQTVIYGVIPQIVPDFVSFIIYHWDINVRISTIIGFVGGGGIGYYLSEQINGFNYNRAGTAVWAIVVVVWAMDFLSAEVRKRLT